MTQFSNIFPKRRTGWLCLAAASVGFATAARAETTTAPINVSLGIYDVCNVTGSTVNLGSYSEEDTVHDVAVRMGSISESGVVTRGSVAPQVVGSVNCPVGIPWSAVVRGDANGQGAPGSFFSISAQVRNQTSFANVQNLPLTGAVVAYAVDGVALPTDQMIGFQSAISRTGTGNPQDIMGSIAIREDGNSDPNLVRGSYASNGVALVVSFDPLP